MRVLPLKIIFDELFMISPFLTPDTVCGSRTGEKLVRALGIDEQSIVVFRLSDLSWRARFTFAAHLWKAMTQQHHRDLRLVFGSHIPVDAVILDIGGHAGQFTKLFASMAPQGHVYTFEPGSYARAILYQAIKFNRLKNVTILPLALSDAPGRDFLVVPEKSSGVRRFGVSHLRRSDSTTPPITQAKSESVPLVKLDDFVMQAALERLDFIKADIEGFEGRMLAGAEQTLKRFRPVLHLELVDDMLNRGGDQLNQVWSWLTQQGYRAWTTEVAIENRQPIAIPRDGEFLFLPE